MSTDYTPADSVAFTIKKLFLGDVYSFIVTDFNGCSQLVVDTFTYDDLRPEVFINVDSSVCAGDDLYLNVSTLPVGAINQYAWSGPNGFSSNVQNPVVSPFVPGDYTVVVLSLIHI